MANYPELRNKVVLITGGANGIGAAMVQAFHEQHAKVFFCDVDESAAQDVIQTAPSAIFRKVDLLKEDQIKKWIAQVGKETGHVAVVVNNAASDPRWEFATMEAKQWDSLFARNLRAYFLVCQKALPLMERGGSIINFGSITFHLGLAQMAAYIATKAGILGFTRALAREVGPRGIRVNTLSPGWIMTARQMKEFVTPAIKRLILKSQCVPDLLQPSEIAEVALFLASDSSRAITGQEILADRGWAHS